MFCWAAGSGAGAGGGADTPPLAEEDALAAAASCCCCLRVVDERSGVLVSLCVFPEAKLTAMFIAASIAADAVPLRAG